MARALPVFAVMLGCATWLWGLLDAGFLLTNDGPSHLLQCRVFQSVDEPGSHFAGFFIANTPVTARGACELLIALGALLPWRAAHQIVLGLPSVLFALAALVATRAIDARRAWGAILVVALSGHTLLYYGLLPYALGAGIAALGLAVLVASAARGELGGWRAVAMFGVSFLLVAICHAVAAAFFAVLASAALLAGVGDRSQLKALLPRYLVAALPALAVLVRAFGYADDNPGGGGLTDWLALPLRARVFLGFSQVGGGWHEVAGVLLPSAGVALAAARVRSLAPAERALMAVALLALLLFWLLPQDALGFLIFAPRALVFFVVFGVAALPLERIPGPRALVRLGVPVLLCGLCALQLAWLWRFHGERARAADETLALLETPIAAPGVRLPIPLDPYLGRRNGEDWGIFGWVPGLHVAQLYAYNQGGAVEYSQDRRAATQWALRTPATRRGDPPSLLRYFKRLDADAREARALEAARAGIDWDSVIVLGDDAEQDVFNRVGYRVDARNPRVLLARFVGCALDIPLRAMPPGERVTLDVRARGARGAWRLVGVTVDDGEDGVVRLRPGGRKGMGKAAPCGEVEVALRAPFQCAEGVVRGASGDGATLTCTVQRRR